MAINILADCPYQRGVRYFPDEGMAATQWLQEHILQDTVCAAQRGVTLVSGIAQAQCPDGSYELWFTPEGVWVP